MPAGNVKINRFKLGTGSRTHAARLIKIQVTLMQFILLVAQLVIFNPMNAVI